MGESDLGTNDSSTRQMIRCIKQVQIKCYSWSKETDAHPKKEKEGRFSNTFTEPAELSWTLKNESNLVMVVGGRHLRNGAWREQRRGGG